MCGRISETCIMRIVIRFLHIFVFCNSCDKEPKWQSDQQSCPNGSIYLVPHFLVEKMDFLKSSNIVFIAWSISDRPYSQIVHVSHIFPTMLKFRTFLQNFVLKSWLYGVSTWIHEISEVLLKRLHISKLVHYYCLFYFFNKNDNKK